MFLIDSVDTKHVFASAGYSATPRLQYLVTNRRVITALLEMYKFHFFFFHFSRVMLALNCVCQQTGPAVQFPVSSSN